METIYAGLLNALVYKTGLKQTDIAEAAGLNPVVLNAYFRSRQSPSPERFRHILRSVGYDYEILPEGDGVTLRLKPTAESR